MRIAIIGQSLFAVEVCKLLKSNGNVIVGVFTIADKNGKEDPLAKAAQLESIPVFKIKTWRKNKVIIPEIFDDYKSVGAELNVLPFCSQYIPMEVITYPKHQTICYHPSLLPAHRGASSINWTLINGDRKGGFTVFWADDGLDTGPILLQKECDISLEDTVDSVYNSFMFPEGIKAMGEAVEMIKNKTAPKIVQPVEGASYDPMLNKEELREINWNSPSLSIHNFIRGMDSSPGAWCYLEGEKVSLFGSEIWAKPQPSGSEVSVKNMVRSAIVHQDGLILYGNDEKMINVRRLCVGGKMVKSSQYGQVQSAGEELVLSEDEVKIKEVLRSVWLRIISVDVNDDTDFFAAGAGSMDVIRLIEEVKEKIGVTLIPEDVFMATSFRDFTSVVVTNLRGGGEKSKLEFDAVKMNVNNMEISFPRQLFIKNKFVDPVEGVWDEVINPSNEEVICKVASGSARDVKIAVEAAKEAFEKGEWGKMNARDRGKLLYKLADLMEDHKEELATIESIDSGAVYTLALKTHIGMSIDTWRYFAGWCDKIEGSTIPINNARPNKNLTITRKEPIGVCGIVIPWNYPLMMLSWKLAACLAAGNTAVIKPAEVTPLSALKFAELAVYAGVPPGVINIVTGHGRIVGEAITSHSEVRKVGFTGSTNIGKRIMSCAALSNAKKVSLELGGKNPLIIFSDCDFEKAVRQGLSSVYFNKGENCIAAGRIFVEESIHDRYVERVVQEVKKLVVGDPLDRGTNHGPQNHLAHLNKLIAYVDRGVEEGAILVHGGKRCERAGYFYMPTVLTNVEDHMYVAKEESFGPVMLISKFKNGDIDGVIDRSNATEFGLAAGVFTKDIDKALHVATKIQAGTCFVNTYNKTDVAAPFGGFKQSGFGKDLGREALNEYLKTKTITFEY